MDPGGEPQPQVGGQVDDMWGEEGEDAPTHGGGAAPAVAAAAQQAAAAYPKIIQDPSSFIRVIKIRNRDLFCVLRSVLNIGQKLFIIFILKRMW